MAYRAPLEGRRVLPVHLWNEDSVQALLRLARGRGVAVANTPRRRSA